MAEKPIPALRAPPPMRDNPLTRSPMGVVGAVFLGVMVLLCILTLPHTAGKVFGSPRYNEQDSAARYLPPTWWGPRWEPQPAPGRDTAADRYRDVARREALRRLADDRGLDPQDLAAGGAEPTPEQLADARPFYLLGTDLFGRSLLVRCLAGGGISLGIGLAAAGLSVLLGTLYGAVAGYAGGRTDALMMRVVDVLYGLPYILLVVLLAVAVESVLDDWQAGRATAVQRQKAEYVNAALASAPPERGADPALKRELETRATVEFGSGELSPGSVQAVNIVTLLVAIGGVSWLTMARVVRGQVLSLKARPFMEAARAMGVPLHRQFLRHLLPNLLGPIIVYATLTVPQAILQESFLSFLGIGVRPPLPSWGNLAAEGLTELNPYKSHWWLLLFPCLLLGSTLLALNFVGEGLREAFDPRRGRR